MSRGFNSENEDIHEQSYKSFVVEHETTLRRVGIGTMIAGIPLGVVAGIHIDFLEIPTAQFALIGLGVIEFTLGYAGRDIKARQQGSNPVQ